MLAPLCAYKPLPHRCEVVGTVAGVEYVNDSKATNLDAVEKALVSETRQVVLIAIKTTCRVSDTSAFSTASKLVALESLTYSTPATVPTTSHLCGRGL